MTQSLDEFFREKKQRSDTQVSGVDWAARRSEWLNAIETLYADIGNWLALPIRQGTVNVSRQPQEITEPHLGTYQIDDLILSVGDERVTFSPKGRNVVGAQGRVDVFGEAGQAMLVVQPGPRWGIVMSRVPRLRIEPLDETSFGQMIEAVMRQ